MPYDIFSRLMYFQTGFFGTNPISYLDSVNVSDQEYMTEFKILVTLLCQSGSKITPPRILCLECVYAFFLELVWWFDD